MASLRGVFSAWKGLVRQTAHCAGGADTPHPHAGAGVAADCDDTDPGAAAATAPPLPDPSPPPECVPEAAMSAAPPPAARFAPGMWIGPVARLAALGECPSILVVKLDHVGDFITALPACERLRQAFPKARLSLLCAPFNCEPALATGLFDAVHAFDYYPARDHPPGQVSEAALAALRALGLPAADIAIDLRHHDDARALLAALPVRFRVGFAGLAARHDLDLALPEMEASVRAGGQADPLPAGVRLSLLAEALVAAFAAARPGGGAAVRAMARRGSPGLPHLPGGPGGYVVLAPGTRLPIKAWPAERWHALAATLLARGAGGIVLVGSADERELCAAIAEGLDPHGVADLSGRLDLPQLAAVMSGGRALVGLDSAPAHLAASLGQPTVVLFSGVVDIASWSPAGPRVAVVTANADCAPCFLPDRAACPHGHGCMEALTPDHALAGLAAAGLEFAGDPSH